MVMHGHWLCLIFHGTTICPPSPDFFQLENTYLPRRVLLCLSSFTYPYAMNYESTDWGSRRMDTTTRVRVDAAPSMPWNFFDLAFASAWFRDSGNSLSLSDQECVCVFLSFQKYCLWCSVMLSDVDWCWLLTDGLCWLYWLVFVDLIVKTQALSGQSGPFFFTKPRRTCLNIWCAYIYIYMYIYILYIHQLWWLIMIHLPYPNGHMSGHVLFLLPWPSVRMGGSTNILW